MRKNMKKTRYKAHHRKNVGGVARNILSFVLVLVTVVAMLPNVSSAAYTQEEAPPAETQAEPESKPDEQADKPEATVYGSIGGALWLDALEDQDSGVYNGDGIRQEREHPIADYTVSLYKAEDKTTVVETVKTKTDGTYIFENLEPGSYVVGISSCTKDDIEYLLPISGITTDNKFADFDGEYTTVYSGGITVDADTVITGVNAGFRNPSEISERAVGIQPSKSDLYVCNQTKIGFGGKQWWVIGDSSTSTPPLLQAPSTASVTLFSDSANFPSSEFNPVSNRVNDYNNSTLQQAMTNAYNNTPTPKEKTYVIPRTMDLQSYPNANAYNYANLTNQNFWPLSAYEYVAMGFELAIDDTHVWLRSPRSPNVRHGLLGAPAGAGIVHASVVGNYAVRPAFYFDMSSVLFSSAAASGGSSDMKSASAGTKELVPAVTLGADEAVKLTMEDDESRTYPDGSGGTQNGRLGMTVDASLTELTASPNDDVIFFYSGAQTGVGRSVSVMICNKDDAGTDPGKILYYGRPMDLSTTNASGMATFTLPDKSDLPIGDYTLKIFNEEVNDPNYTDYASIPKEVGLRVRETEVSLSANPDNLPVYYTDTTSGSVELTATVKNHLNNGTTIQDAQWLRVPISDTADYSADTVFDTAYAGAGIASVDKGTLTAASNDNITATFLLPADRNAKYWFKGTVFNPGTNVSHTDVSSITVDNLYKEIICTVSGMNHGVNPSSALYTDEPIPGQYGIPYDLDGTTPLVAPSLGFNTITLSAKTQYIPYGTVTTQSGHPLTQGSNAKAVILDGSTNAECDTGDYTKYTLNYSIKRYVVTINISGVIRGSYDQLSDAENACLPGVPCTITASADDPSMGSEVLVSSGKDITLTSINPGSPRTITQTQDGRHLYVNGGKLTLKNITLEGEGLTTTSTMTMNGGVRVSNSGSLTMEAGATITKCWGNASNGGGLHLTGGTFTMNGGAITLNQTAGSGGGIVAANQVAITMTGGLITNNEAVNGGGISLTQNTQTTMNGGLIANNKAVNGGGIHLANAAEITMSGEATIDHNTATTNGGGLYIIVNGTAPPVTMNGGSITNNTAANGVGGGVYVFTTSQFNMSGGSIAGNTAKTNGGGIFTANNSYADPANTAKYNNIYITSPAKVGDNTAMSGTEVPPSNAAAFNSRFPGALLNNDNINYRGPKVTVTISKAVTGNYGDMNKAFEFTITIQDTNGTPLASGKTLTYTGGTISSGATAPANGMLTLNSAGSATFTLGHGQSITVSGIPSAGKVQVAETVDSRYNTTYWIDSASIQTGTDTGVISMNGTNRTVDFLNDGKSVVATGLPGRTAQKGILSIGAVLCLAGTFYTIIRKVRRKRRE